MDPMHRNRGPRDDRREEQNRKDRLRKYRLEWARLNDRKRRVYTPWLLIRYRTSDLGLRPIPAGEAHWVSPDIWVESSDPSGSAVAAEDNFVHARIFNLGKATAVPTRVDFYWADPSVGLGPGYMNLIGTEWVSIEPHTAMDVRCATPWVPVFLNNGHECLMVNCTNPILDPIAYPFEPRQDRHVGQRNISVLQAPAGEFVPFVVAVNNLIPLAVEATITARIEHMRVMGPIAEKLTPLETTNLVAAFGARPALEPMELRSLYRPGARDFGRAARLSSFLQRTATAHALLMDVSEDLHGAQSAVSLKTAWTGEMSVRKPARQGAAAANLLLADDELARGGAFQTIRESTVQRATLEGFEQRRLALEIGIPPGAAAGEFFAVHLSGRVGGMLIGGYTVVVQVSRRAKGQEGRS